MQCVSVVISSVASYYNGIIYYWTTHINIRNLNVIGSLSWNKWIPEENYLKINEFLLPFPTIYCTRHPERDRKNGTYAKKIIITVECARVCSFFGDDSDGGGLLQKSPLQSIKLHYFRKHEKHFFSTSVLEMRLKEKIVCTVMFDEFIVRGIVHRIISSLWKISKDTRNTLENHINTKPSSADKCACLSSSSRLNIRDQASMIPMRWRPTPIEIIEWLPDSENV